MIGARLGMFLVAALAVTAACSQAPSALTSTSPSSTTTALPSHDGTPHATASQELTPLAPGRAGVLPEVPLDKGDASRGEQLFGSVGCTGCHSVRGNGGTIGPDLTDVALRAPGRAEVTGVGRPELYFVQSIVNPTAYVVEGFFPVMLDWKQMNLTEQDLADVVAFLSTLKGVN